MANTVNDDGSVVVLSSTAPQPVQCPFCLQRFSLDFGQSLKVRRWEKAQGVWPYCFEHKVVG